MRAARGQATVELALGVMVFVTVLLLGIHFAELSWLSLKVTEAARFAMFNATGHRVQHFTAASASNPNSTYSPFNSVPGEVSREATNRYASFDGRTSRAGGGSVDLALTHGEGLSVQCEWDNRMSFAIPRRGGGGDPFFAPTQALVRRYYQDRGGLRCSAQAQVGSTRIPESYADGSGGFFQEPQWRSTPLTLCGAARARGGRCPGGYSILLGDWSLEGPADDRVNQSVLHQRQSGDNAPYRNLVRELFEVNGKSRGDAASKFAVGIGGAGRSPHDESEFHMSYAGWEYFYTDYTTQAVRPRDTAGEFRQRQRGFCFLGQKCR